MKENKKTYRFFSTSPVTVKKNLKSTISPKFIYKNLFRSQVNFIKVENFSSKAQETADLKGKVMKRKENFGKLKEKSNLRTQVLKHLMDCGIHLGHSKKTLHKNMKGFVLGIRKGRIIFDLDKTIESLHKARMVLENVKRQKGHIMYVGTGEDIAPMMTAQLVGKENLSFVSSPWVGGSLTNFSIKNTSKTLRSSDKVKKNKFNSKAGTKIDQKENSNKKQPDILVIFNLKENQTALKEANKVRIPVIAIVDSDCDPRGVNFVIAGNDESLRAQFLYQNLLIV